MYAPAGFELPTPLSSGSHPPPELQKYFKHQVYDRPDVFSKVDEHAIQVAGCDHPAFRDLMWDLVFRYKLDELERARVIFRWMSSKDMQNIRFESSPPNSPEEVLLSFKYNRGTFARIFEIMCSYSNIHCITVSGYAKGVDYLPGDRFSGLPSNHSWNVIYIRGSWQLVDAHWAARYLSSGRNVPENVVYEYDDFYFMMEPQQAVYSHFPEDPRWQLLPVPLTLTQFESLPLTKSQFFKCAIDFLEQHHGVVYTRDGRLRMTLGFWRPGGFTYKLQYLTTSAGHRHPETLPASPSDLSDRVPNLDVDLKADLFVYTKFLLLKEDSSSAVFLGLIGASRILPNHIADHELSNLTIGRESTFRAACEYKIICDAPASDAQTYPTCHDANWGPAWPHVQHYALEPSHSEGVISVTSKRDLTTSTDGRTLPPATVDIHFSKQRPEVSLLAKLHRNGVPDDFLDQYQRVVETARETQFHVTLPEPGEYGLEIYANEPAEGDTYTHMCQYLIHYEAPAGWRPTTPRLTASGSDAGPSPQAMQSWHPNDSTGDNASYQPGDASRWSASNVQPAGPLKDMYNYELHAPPMGQLPRPYADSQYAEANTSLKFGKSQFPNRYSPSYGRTSSPVNAPNRASFNYAPRTGLIATGTAQDRFVSPAAPKASMEAISDLTGSLSSVRLRQSSESILVNKNQIHRSRLSDLEKHTDDVPSTSHCSQPKGQVGTANKDCLLTVQPYMANVARGGSPVLLGRRDPQLQLDNRRVSFDPTLVGPGDESHTSDLPLPSPPPYVRLNSWSSSGDQKKHRDPLPPVVCVCVLFPICQRA
ncbi:Kyphoscoliosis peptidase [Paragonimus kellicotti]|nr:Kyphoscoliosis peptidase [Paragonimus kellicotti]